MRRFISSIGLLALIACGGLSTGPLGLDPAILFNNHLDTSVSLEWRDGQSVIGNVTVPAHAVDFCVHFLARPDSAYFQIIATENPPGLPPRTSTITADWFHPETRPAWTVDITPGTNGSSPSILIRDIAEMCVETP